MTKKNSTMSGIKTIISKEELGERIESKLLTRGIANPASATNDQIYQATVSIIKELMLEYRSKFKKRIKATDGKKICYLCMEFLVGRSLKTNIHNLCLVDQYTEALKELVKFNLDKGVNGFYVGGSTGEAFLLSADERKEV